MAIFKDTSMVHYIIGTSLFKDNIFLCPELISIPWTSDFKMDIWAFGVVMLYILEPAIHEILCGPDTFIHMKHLNIMSEREIEQLIDVKLKETKNIGSFSSIIMRCLEVI